MARLSINNLCKTYDNGLKALDNVALDLNNGIFGLLGPNGAGKSSLMRTLATLQSTDSGTVVFDGVDILNNPGFMRKQLGYLPQDFGVYPRISALDLLDHMAVLKGILNRKDRKEQVAALLQQTNLYTARNQSVNSFSGGMRQRFGIAQALLGNPQLVVVDEPTAGLDPEERNRFHDLLSEISEQIVVVLSTHIVDDVRDLCRQMAVIASGRILLTGNPDQLALNMNGLVWEKRIGRNELPQYQADHRIISTKYIAGQLRVLVLGEEKPADGFRNIEPGLEAVYFNALHTTKRKEELC